MSMSSTLRSVCPKEMDSSVRGERPKLLEEFHGRLEEDIPGESNPRGRKRISYPGMSIDFFSYHC